MTDLSRYVPSVANPGGLRPWEARDAINLVWINLVGIIGLVVGYLVAAGTVNQRNQFISTAVAIGAVAVTGLGNAVWLTNGARVLRQRQAAVVARAHVLLDRLLREPSLPEELSASGAAVASATMTRYHRPDCLLVAGKSVEATPVEAHQRAGRGPCVVCNP